MRVGEQSRQQSSNAIAIPAPYIKCFRLCSKNESKPPLLIPPHLLGHGVSTDVCSQMKPCGLREFPCHNTANKLPNA